MLNFYCPPIEKPRTRPIAGITRVIWSFEEIASRSAKHDLAV
jgi:hypothetical protein